MTEKKYPKGLIIRLPFECWKFLKHKSVDLERSMNSLMVEYVAKDKTRTEKRLTTEDKMIS